MYKSIFLLFLVLTITCPIAAQLTFEAEAWNFALAYERAIIDNDAAFLEKHLDRQFISIGQNSHVLNREESIAQARAGAENAYRVIDLDSIAVRIETTGNLVVITSNWRVVRQSTTAINALPQTHTGSSTTVFRKLDEWMILSEHVSFDRPETKDIVKDVGETGQKYVNALVSRNIADLGNYLSARFVRTDETGRTQDKQSFLADIQTSKLTFGRIRHSSVYVNFYDNSAVETGISQIDGTRDGQQFAERYQYTRSWIKQDDRWQIFAEHFSAIRERP